uniref:BZIP domain-containing protein n=1 Tax=Hyaloperonospora arabidopsidis (strain Emoy2) TaxID=559515 RepID=M4BNB4_HYAAE
MPGLQTVSSNGLAPIHGGRMSSQMGTNSMLFPSLGRPSTSAASAATASSLAAKEMKTTKKRKAPSLNVERESGEDGRKQPEEFEDPKAKRRAQIAKAARKHRQRQKDELIALRAKVKDLKEQIEVLQSSEPSEHNTELGWKQEAEQHAEIRARVDQENEFLRKTLMEQMKFIQRLQDYFTKQPLLNMPSLDMILNSSTSAATTPTALSNAISAVPSVLQLQSGSFRDRLIDMTSDAMTIADKQLTACEAAFRNPRTSTMTYFGLQVQYEMGKNEMCIYFRHNLFGCNATVVMNDFWSVIGDANYEKGFPFIETAEVLDEIDANTKYVRRVVNLTMSSDTAVGGGVMKEESLTINQKRDNADGTSSMISQSVMDDPNHPKLAGHFRRNATTAVFLKNFNDSTGQGCLLLWSVKVQLNKDPEERAKNCNIPDIILKNLFEVAPVFVKGVVDRARGTVPQG